MNQEINQQKPILQENKSKLWIYFLVGLGIIIFISSIAIYIVSIKNNSISEGNITASENASEGVAELTETSSSTETSTQSEEPMDQNTSNDSTTEIVEDIPIPLTEEDYLS